MLLHSETLGKPSLHKGGNYLPLRVERLSKNRQKMQETV
jgi:hypothetical protein